MTTTDRDGEYWHFRRLVERVLADIDADRRDALRRCPGRGGCAYCGVTHADPIVLGWDNEVPPWTSHQFGDVCATCSELAVDLADWQLRARVTARLLDLGTPNVVPVMHSDPLVVAGQQALHWFHELPHAKPTGPPWAHVDVPTLRTAYEVAGGDDEPPYETAEPCPDCGTPDRWIRVPFRQEVRPVTSYTVADDGTRSEPVHDRIDILDYPEHLECGRCRTLQAVTPRRIA